MVLRWFISWILASNHLVEITVESDSEVTVKCSEGSVCEAQLENIIQDCKDFLSSLPNVTVKSIRRSKNAAAHELVSVARNLAAKSWAGCVPDPVAKIVCTESSAYR